ncbi:MAG: pantoate--beta-alanine ligase [Candidatus Nanopelagicales bacterium]
MNIVVTREELAQLPPVTGSTAVVMTMGALHAGHAHLIDVARGYVGDAGRIIVTIFVNPLQFGAGEDFDIYPRTLDDDVQLCQQHGADVVFAPSVSEVYADAATGDDVASGVSIVAGPLGDILEGASRPGHFSGVLTVVAKLFHLTRANFGLFGEKDYQQLVLIRAMVQALNFPVRVIGVPTVRESDGLALSSRNRYLSVNGRHLAAAIPAAMQRGLEVAHEGASSVELIVRKNLESVGLQPDYVVVTGTDLKSAPLQGQGRLLVAVKIESTRLLDNMPVSLGEPA